MYRYIYFWLSSCTIAIVNVNINTFPLLLPPTRPCDRQTKCLFKVRVHYLSSGGCIPNCHGAEMASTVGTARWAAAGDIQMRLQREVILSNVASPTGHSSSSQPDLEYIYRSILSIQKHEYLVLSIVNSCFYAYVSLINKIDQFCKILIVTSAPETDV